MLCSLTQLHQNHVDADRSLLILFMLLRLNSALWNKVTGSCVLFCFSMIASFVFLAVRWFIYVRALWDGRTNLFCKNSLYVKMFWGLWWWRSMFGFSFFVFLSTITGSWNHFCALNLKCKRTSFVVLWIKTNQSHDSMFLTYVMVWIIVKMKINAYCCLEKGNTIVHKGFLLDNF